MILKTSSGAAPADARQGDRSTVADRRVAAVAAATVADAIERWRLNYGGSSRGLRGGRWTWSGDRLTRFRFSGARFTRDVPVYGSATWRLGTARSGRSSGSPAAAGCWRAGTCASRSRRRRSRDASAAAACGRRCSRL